MIMEQYVTCTYCGGSKTNCRTGHTTACPVCKGTGVWRADREINKNKPPRSIAESINIILEANENLNKIALQALSDLSKALDNEAHLMRALEEIVDLPTGITDPKSANITPYHMIARRALANHRR